jgi:hypothetical protein
MVMRTLRGGMVPSVVGLVAAVSLYPAVGWWLNSGRGVVAATTVLFAAALVICLPSTERWRRAAALWIGALVGMAVTLFWSGPGTIWPIVMVVAAALAGAAIFSGAGVARLVRPRR